MKSLSFLLSFFGFPLLLRAQKIYKSVEYITCKEAYKTFRITSRSMLDKKPDYKIPIT